MVKGQRKKRYFTNGEKDEKKENLNVVDVKSEKMKLDVKIPVENIEKSVEKNLGNGVGQEAEKSTEKIVEKDVKTDEKLFDYDPEIGSISRPPTAEEDQFWEKRTKGKKEKKEKQKIETFEQAMERFNSRRLSKIFLALILIGVSLPEILSVYFLNDANSKDEEKLNHFYVEGLTEPGVYGAMGHVYGYDKTVGRNLDILEKSLMWLKSDEEDIKAMEVANRLAPFLRYDKDLRKKAVESGILELFIQNTKSFPVEETSIYSGSVPDYLVVPDGYHRITEIFHLLLADHPENVERLLSPDFSTQLQEIVGRNPSTGAIIIYRLSRTQNGRTFLRGERGLKDMSNYLYTCPPAINFYAIGTHENLEANASIDKLGFFPKFVQDPEWNMRHGYLLYSLPWVTMRWLMFARKTKLLKFGGLKGYKMVGLKIVETLAILTFFNYSHFLSEPIRDVLAQQNFYLGTLAAAVSVSSAALCYRTPFVLLPITLLVVSIAASDEARDFFWRQEPIPQFSQEEGLIKI